MSIEDWWMGEADTGMDEEKLFVVRLFVENIGEGATESPEFNPITLMDSEIECEYFGEELERPGYLHSEPVPEDAMLSGTYPRYHEEAQFDHGPYPGDSAEGIVFFSLPDRVVDVSELELFIETEDGEVSWTFE